jgi:hypothetical protein
MEPAETSRRLIKGRHQIDVRAHNEVACTSSRTTKFTPAWQARIDLLDQGRTINALHRSAEQDDKR